MLTVRDGETYESFARPDQGRPSAVNSSSDESVSSAKIKKHVRWADTDDGRDLASYDSCSDSDDPSSDDEGIGDVEGKGSDAVPVMTTDLDDEEDEDEGDDDDDEENTAENCPPTVDDRGEPDDSSSSSDSDEDEASQSDPDDEADEKDETSKQTDEAEDNIVDDEDDEDVDEDEEEKENDETDRPISTDNLADEVARLQEELLNKAASLQQTQNALDSAVLEAGRISEKIERLQEEITKLKNVNAQLQFSLDQRNFSPEAKLLLEARVAELEAELAASRSARNLLESRLSQLERERNEEMTLVQQTLESAMNEQAEREAKYQKEFETERTLSSQRELQMLEDFEWKLRETERNARKKIELAEAEATKRIQNMEMRLARAESDLERIGELKLCEIELKHLKVSSSEQRRNLRQVTRLYEELQVNEKILQEEVNRMRAAHEKEKLQWEEKIRRELAKLKVELEKTHREERIVAINLANLTKDQEIAALRDAWKKKENDYLQQISRLTQKLESKDMQHRQSLENTQSSFDRNAMDLRRKMDKLDMDYQTRLEKMQEAHETEMGKVKTDYEEKIAQIEASYQLQIDTLRSSIDSLKQQLMEENQARIEQLKSLHRQQLEEQWEASAKEKRAEVRAVEERHMAALEQLRKELDEIRKVGQPSTVSTPNSQSVIGSLFRYFTQAVSPNSKQSSHRSQIPDPLKQVVMEQMNHDAANPFCCGTLDGIEEVATGSDAEKILYAKVQQLMCQSHEDKAEIARLRRCLEETDCVKQQKPCPPQPQQRQQNPPHPSRRNRKRRN